jgi:uncharacterized Ntn-hydrolase superfamily protein
VTALGHPEPFAHTYSIVAIDPKTGDMGVAVQSHWFSVGSVVTWGEAGVGVVATQAMANASYGPDGLALLRAGKAPKKVVEELTKPDVAREMRQLAVLDAKGRVATHTGRKCIPEAGHALGEGYSCQANMMLNKKVWPAMADAFERAKGPLAERMLAALDAGEEAGGDIRGRQSAAMLVVRGKSIGKVWEDHLVDLRVEDSEAPLPELHRLLKVHRAYEHMNNGDLAMEKGNMTAALGEYRAAERMFPENEEMMFWHAVTLANSGRVAQSLPLFAQVFSKNENWRELARRMVPDFLHVEAKALKRILAQ